MIGFNRLAIASLIGLILFGLAWELWLAPLRPGGSTLALKVVPLLLPLFGILRGLRYTHQWASLLALAYVAEGLIRIGSDVPGMRWAPAVELALASALFVGCVGYARTAAPSRQITPED